MPLSTQLPFLYVAHDDVKGRSVFTSEKIEEGSIVEICHVIILNKEDTRAIHETHLHDYYFVWDIVRGTSALALGFGSLYNHDDDNNAEFELDLIEKVIRIIAQRNIEAGEEITLDYKGHKEEGNELWF